jgi:hypothetical protein
MKKQREDCGFGVDVVHHHRRRLEGLSGYLADSPGSSDDYAAVGEAVILNTGTRPVNVILSVGISAPRLPLPVNELRGPRFRTAERIMTRILDRPGHISAVDGSVVRLDVEMHAYVATYYRPDMSIRALARGSLADVQQAMRGWTHVA